jgi:uncharacterized membrane protein YbhN (UPF0104 family)
MRFKLSRTWTKTLLGIGVVLENVSRFGAWFAAILIVGSSWLFFQACAWSIIQNAYFQKVPFFRMFRVRITSDALNSLLPSASLGGDAARRWSFSCRRKRACPEYKE